MIKINELRQGNLVQQTNDGITSIFQWDFIYIAMGVNKYFKVGGSEVTVDPVPIDDNWLTMLNMQSGSLIWEKAPYGLKMYKNLCRDASGRYDGIHFSQMIGRLTEKHITNVVCRYIHELQNFFFTFTGEELKLPYSE